MSRAHRVKTCARKLCVSEEGRSAVGPAWRALRIADGDRVGTSTVIVAGELQVEPTLYPKKLRQLCWEIRTVEFLDGENAVMLARYDTSEQCYVYGVGVVSTGAELTERARAAEMIVVEVD